MFDGCLFYIRALLEVYSIFELTGKYIIHVHNWCSLGQLTLFWNTDLDTGLLILNWQFIPYVYLRFMLF